ncbi:hypothetical protein AB0454_22715 [Streptomyces sp. NPDC093509]|uniref:ParB/RepB/Spo0J family partition protein n=1 Tax=Streptomyces sp. NPDC093509 TaxID=3154982 RepID=UPI00344E3846
MAGRRTSLASLAGQKIEDVPGQGEPLLLSLPLDKMIPTRFNPRRRFGTDEELSEFGRKLAKQQLQPAVVVSRAGYLKLWPEEAERVGTIPYVIANGERRYRASKLVARPTLDVVHNESVAASRAVFLDAVQQENNERENLDPIERAIAIETMVTELGGADHVAVYYDKTKGWVSQQRKLLRLTPELQDLVSLGEMPVRVGRDIASLPPEHQADAWQAEVEARAAAKALPRPERRAPQPPAPAPVLQPTPQPERFTAVNQDSDPPAPEAQPAAVPAERFTAVNQPPPEPGAESSTEPASDVAREVERTAEAIPEPRSHQGDEQEAGDGQPKRLPYGDGLFLGQHLAIKVDNEPYFLMLRVLLEKGREKDPQAYEALLKEVTAGTSS